MKNNAEIITIYQESFRVNVFTKDPFRMIGLIDVDIRYSYGMERVTLAYYRSSGTNSGKIEGLWYPIVGIKLHTGRFREFTKYLNCVLTKSTKNGYAHKGWLAKSLFFNGHPDGEGLRGFSYGIHQEKLFQIGKLLSHLYEDKKYHMLDEMDAKYLNCSVNVNKVLYRNHHTQKENYELFIEDIFKKSK